MTPPARLPAARPQPPGMTLLEVLVSCGVLMLGLAGIAALLPAAGSRLGQASLEDRAGALVANARSDVTGRRLAAFDLFTDPNKSLGFGRGGAGLPGVAAQHFAAASPRLAERIDLQRGFLLEDEVSYLPPTRADTPVNDFPSGRRGFREGLCWGATLAPKAFPATAGSAATLGIAVFRKEPTLRAIPLTRLAGGLYRMTTADETVMTQFLKSCSYVVVPPVAPGQPPRWSRVTASWRPPLDPATNLRTNDGCYVVFADADFETFAGATPTVVGFDGIVRLDQYNVILK